MNLNEYLESCGVVIVKENCTRNYKNLENVVGKQVWICDYRNSKNGADLKPIRNIKPTLVKICINDDKHSVCYSPIHFREIQRNNKLSSRIIAPYDNTGYRCLTGTSLNIFDNREECVKCFNMQVEKAIKEIKEAARKHANFYKEKINELADMTIKEIV